MKQQKVNKNDFLGRVARKHNMDARTVREVYDSIVDELTEIVCDDQSLSLTGFGTFSLKQHKGHPVQFGAKVNEVDTYKVLKFTASDVLTSRIRHRILDKSEE